MTVSSSNTQIYSSMASASTFLPKNDIKNDEAKKKVEKGVEKKKEKKGKGLGKEKAVGHTPAFFLPSTRPANKTSSTVSINPKPILSIESAPDFGLPVVAVAAVDHDDNDSRRSECEVNSEDGDGSSIVNPTCLIDIESKSLNTAKNGGRPMHLLLNDLVQKCYNTKRPEKHIFRCKGGCGKTFSNRNGARIIRHATGCHRLPVEP